MSTRSRIGIQYPDGTIKSIYCKYDGGYDKEFSVGYILRTYYKTPELVEKLLALGNLGSLGKIPEEDSAGWDDVKSNPDLCSTYRSAYPDNPAVNAKIHPNIDEYIYAVNCDYGDYAYLFKNNNWYFIDMDDEPNRPFSKKIPQI